MVRKLVTNKVVCIKNRYIFKNFLVETFIKYPLFTWQQFVKIRMTYSSRTAPLKNVNNCLNTNIYTYLETSGSQSLDLYLNAAEFFNTSVN
jgi:hypothetical protein